MPINLIELIISANIIEKVVLVLLVIMSLVSWVIIFQHFFIVKRARSILIDFEEVFWSGIDLNKFYRSRRQEFTIYSGIENVFAAGFREFTRLNKIAVEPDVVIESVQRMMRIAIHREEELLGKNLALLASIGSVSPYIGLFGTVAGVLDAFLAMSLTDQVTLQQIAPGIAQALIATAMGLFVAIPAVWSYNHLTNKIDILLSSYYTFADEFASVLNRKLRQTHAPSFRS